MSNIIPWRQKDTDNFSTSMEVWNALLSQIPKAKVFDPCFHDGLAATNIAGCGHIPVHECKDFLNPRYVVPEYDLLATNPPFSDPKSFLRRIVDITLINRKPFAVLLPVASQESKYFGLQFGRLAHVGEVVEIQVLSLGKMGKMFIGPDLTPTRKGRGTMWFVHGLSLADTSGILFVDGNRAGTHV